MQLNSRTVSLLVVLSAVAIIAVTAQTTVVATPEPTQQEPAEPTADFRTSPVQPAPFEEVRFDASTSIVPAEGYTRYQWEYETTRGVRRASGETFTHTFQSAQTFEVRLTVTDSRGNTDTVVGSVTPRADPPTADFSIDPSEPELSERIVFDASASEAPDVEIVDYRWFINGEPESTDRRLTRTFSTSDLYTVELRVEDRAGQTDRYSKTLEIGDRDEIYDNPEFDLLRTGPEKEIGVNPNERIPFTAEITSDEVPQGTYTFYVDDSVITQEDIEINSLRETHQFQQLGRHTVQMEVEGEAGQSAVVQWDVTTHTFNSLPSISEQSSSTQLEVGGDTEVITFSLQNPSANEQELSAEIKTRLPDGMSISGGGGISTSDGSLVTSRQTVSPGQQVSMRLDINVDDESLDGTRINIPYLIEYHPVNNDRVVYTADQDTVEVVVGTSDRNQDESTPTAENDDETEPSTADGSPGFTLLSVVMGLLVTLVALNLE